MRASICSWERAPPSERMTLSSSSSAPIFVKSSTAGWEGGGGGKEEKEEVVGRRRQESYYTVVSATPPVWVCMKQRVGAWQGRGMCLSQLGMGIMRPSNVSLVMMSSLDGGGGQTRLLRTLL